MEPGAPSLNDYIDILRRRRWSLILPAAVVFSVVGAVALLLPSIFKSSSTILIEQQEIPPELVMTTVTSFAEQRLQQINQRIMSTTRLMEIIQQFDLYKDLRDRWTTEEIIDKMREDIKLGTISAEVMDRRTGRATAATIAFTLSYEGKNAATVQKVANRLASLYLEENLQVRERQTQEASTFLEEEMERVKAQLADVEKRMALFKESHINELPELMQVNLGTLNAIESGIERFEEQLRGLKEREGFLQTQLSVTEPTLEAQARANRSEDEIRLELLETQMVTFKTRYSDEHPDVLKTRSEIAALKEKLAAAAPSTQTGASAAAAPAAGSAESGAALRVERTTVNGEIPENPAYINLSSQLAGTRVDIETLKRQMDGLRKRVEVYRRRIEATPRVEETYNTLQIERQNLQGKFNELMAKFQEARVAHGLEREQKGERFTLIDPARLPEKPYRPNRLAIALIGVVLSMGAGVGFAALREFSDHAVRRADVLSAVSGLPVLASIPHIVTREDIRRRRLRRAAAALSLVVLLGTSVAVFHYYVMDLDVFKAKLDRKIDRLTVF